VKRRTDADGAHFGAVALAAARLPLGPTEHLGASIERILQVGARDPALPRAQLRGVVGRVEAPNRHAIDAELLGRLVDEWLDGGRDLVLTGPALGAARRGIRHHTDTPRKRIAGG
jgi:hypothetical protein